LARDRAETSRCTTEDYIKGIGGDGEQLREGREIMIAIPSSSSAPASDSASGRCRARQAAGQRAIVSFSEEMSVPLHTDVVREEPPPASEGLAASRSCSPSPPMPYVISLCAR